MTEKIRREIPEVLQEIGKIIDKYETPSVLVAMAFALRMVRSGLTAGQIAAFEKLEESMIVDIDSKFQKGGHC